MACGNCVSLAEKIRVLRDQLTFQSESNYIRNQQLDALHMVWCDGGCPSGVHRYQRRPLTPEVVAEAVINTCRLVSWYVSNKGRQFYEEKTGTLQERWKKAYENIEQLVAKAIKADH